MPDRPWRSSSRSSSSSTRPWRTSRSARAPEKKDDGGGIGGFLGNLATDVEDAVVGLGPAFVQMGSAVGHDVASLAGRVPGSRGYARQAARRGFQTDDIARAIGESYAYSYGPLFRGDIGEFGHRLYEHPLGPILDVVAVLSVGAGAFAKAGVAPAALKRGAIELRTPAGKIVSRPLPRQTLRAELQVGRTALLNKLPAETPVFGEAARAGRALRKGPHKIARATELLEQPFVKALSRIRAPRQRLAAFWLSQVPLPDDLGRLAKMLEDEGSPTALATAKMLRDPKFLAAYSNPSSKLLSVVDEASQVAAAQKAVLGVTDDVALRRAYMPTLLARGARFVDDPEAGAGLVPPMVSQTRPRLRDEAAADLRSLETEIDRALRPLVDEAFPPAVRKREQAMRNVLPHTRGKRSAAGLEREIEQWGVGGQSSSVLANAQERIEAQILRMAETPDADPNVQALAARIQERDALRAKVNDPEAVFGEAASDFGMVEELVPTPGFGSIEDMIRQIDADLAAAGRPKPVYMPHTSEQARAVHVYGTGGVGPQKAPGPLHQTMGVLLGRGQLIQDPMVLRASFVKSIKYALYRDIHKLHVEHAQKIAPGEPVPKGWQVVRRSHAEKTPYTVKTGAEFEEFAKSFLDEEAGFTFRENPFVARTAGEALVDERGYRLIVPREFSRQLAGEFVRSGRFVEFMNRYPIRVWRHLVLKLRPAWLVNNIIGNTLLYLVHSSDPVALQELAGTLRRLTPKRQRKAFDELMRKHFPEQVHGTFIGSQLPVSPMGSRLERFLERPASIVGAGLAQIDRTWEQALRSAVVRTELRKSPELKKFARTMRTQTDEFWKLADEELAKNPLLAEKISNRVNDALGDFLALGRYERDVIRAFFPFYAWYRVITLITVSLPLTHPLKAPLLARLGQAGTQTALEELGIDDRNAINYAKGFFALGPEEDGRVPGLATTSANPFATVAALQDSVLALAMLPLVAVGAKQMSYQERQNPPYQQLPGLNPLMALIIEGTTGVQSASGNRYGLLGAIPQFALGQTLLNKQYQSDTTLSDRDRMDAILRYLGIPYSRIRPERAVELAERGQR